MIRPSLGCHCRSGRVRPRSRSSASIVGFQRLSQLRRGPTTKLMDKVAADQAVIDKVAADKVVADKKAAADKVVADKAAANRAAADKAAADKAAAAKRIADANRLTAAQENAKRKAESYIEMSGFCRSGLIEQLKFEGFTNAQAAHGAASVGL